MPRKKRYRRARRLGRKIGRRAAKAKPPLETYIGGISIPFTPAQTGWGSPIEFLSTGNMQGMMDSLKSGFLGMDPWTGRIDFFAALNPFNFESARYTKMLVGSTLIGMARKKLVGRYTTPFIKKIPWIGRIAS